MTMSARAWRAGIAHTVSMPRAPGTPPRPILDGGSPLAPSSADPVFSGHRDPLRAGSLLPQRLAGIAAEVQRAGGSGDVETTVACPPDHGPQPSYEAPPYGGPGSPSLPGRPDGISSRETSSSTALLVAGLSLVIAGAAWWLLSPYAEGVGPAAMIVGLVLLVVAWRRR